MQILSLSAIQRTILQEEFKNFSFSIFSFFFLFYLFSSFFFFFLSFFFILLFFKIVFFFLLFFFFPFFIFFVFLFSSFYFFFSLYQFFFFSFCFLFISLVEIDLSSFFSPHVTSFNVVRDFKRHSYVISINRRSIREFHSDRVASSVIVGARSHACRGPHLMMLITVASSRSFRLSGGIAVDQNVPREEVTRECDQSEHGDRLPHSCSAIRNLDVSSSSRHRTPRPRHFTSSSAEPSRCT